MVSSVARWRKPQKKKRIWKTENNEEKQWHDLSRSSHAKSLPICAPSVCRLGRTSAAGCTCSVRTAYRCLAETGLKSYGRQSEFLLVSDSYRQRSCKNFMLVILIIWSISHWTHLRSVGSKSSRRAHNTSLKLTDLAELLVERWNLFDQNFLNFLWLRTNFCIYFCKRWSYSFLNFHDIII